MQQSDNVIDFIATLLVCINPILQYYLSTLVSIYIIQGIQVFRVLRLLRLCSYLPGMKYNQSITIAMKIITTKQQQQQQKF